MNKISPVYCDPGTVKRLTWLNCTDTRLIGFGQRKAGWDLGRGETISTTTIQEARSILYDAFDMGLWQSNVFASPSGSVLLTFTTGEHDVEIGVEGNGTFDLTYERNDRPVMEETSIGLPTLHIKLGEIADTICTSEPSTSITMMKTYNASEAQHLSHQVMVDSPSFVYGALKPEVDPFVSISLDTTVISQEYLPSSGYSANSIYRQEALAA
jgi:hypothetical protein